jgi:hypothetical protein
MPNKTWKASERKVAKSFGTKRNSLSGSNSKVSSSDTTHDKLYIENKYRVKHTAITLWTDTKEKAKKENKTPVVCLCEKNKKGFWVLVHIDDLKQVADEMEAS